MKSFLIPTQVAQLMSWTLLKITPLIFSPAYTMRFIKYSCLLKWSHDSFTLQSPGIQNVPGHIALLKNPLMTGSTLFSIFGPISVKSMRIWTSLIFNYLQHMYVYVCAHIVCEHVYFKGKRETLLIEWEKNKIRIMLAVILFSKLKTDNERL